MKSISFFSSISKHWKIRSTTLQSQDSPMMKQLLSNISNMYSNRNEKESSNNKRIKSKTKRLWLHSSRTLNKQPFLRIRKVRSLLREIMHVFLFIWRCTHKSASQNSMKLWRTTLKTRWRVMDGRFRIVIKAMLFASGRRSKSTKRITIVWVDSNTSS